ncbi:hypothetical protein [Pontitalea aquivivens]|uniref:hypothetical protein n=1 Tax=Pontitalea aquivivens TaxID=3388663 RepID=UPI0039708063
MQTLTMFSHVRTAYGKVQKGAAEMVALIADHDHDYEQITLDRMASAAAHLEDAARQLRDLRAVAADQLKNQSE